MQSDKMQREEVIEEILLTLAEFFKTPTEELFWEVKHGEMDMKLKNLFEQAGYTYSISIKDLFADYHTMKQTFMRCFSGITIPYAPPIESLYKVWTEDPTADVTHARSKGYLMGDAALHIRYLFEQYNIEIPAEFKSMPDHLTLLLEFWAFLIQNASKEKIGQYVSDHLDWLGDFKKELTKLDNCSFYILITELVITIINGEKSVYSVHVQ